MAASIVFLPGDGVGPEVANAAKAVLEQSARRFDIALNMEEALFGGAAIDAAGDPLPGETLRACQGADAIFLGAVGGPKWDGGGPRPEAGLLKLRAALGVYANLRPTFILPGLEDLAPLKRERVAGVDFLMVRELTGGIYFGDRIEGDEQAQDICAYSADEVRRVARKAFEAARLRKGRVTSVDKANVLATSRLWRKTVTALRNADYPDVALDHMLVDAMAMKLIQNPAAFDVVLTENLFGDILSDEASVIGGSIGLAPSASLGDGTRGLYEPIHGSAPDIAGQDIANPAGAILSVAMMLRFSLDHENAARAIEDAVNAVIASGARTRDLGGDVGTQDFAKKVVAAI
jgi:3-isopropylmalate dehydrogenase